MIEPRVLHITNGDYAVHNLKEAGFSGEFLPVRDVLHVGPLLPGDDFIGISSARCQFIVAQGWASQQRVDAFQRERRALLRDLTIYAEIWLWFEHDLYDQLQLIRVLQFLAESTINLSQVRLVVTDQYLGEANAETCQELLRFAEPLSSDHLETACHIWEQLTATTPASWPEMLQQSYPLLPFLQAALRRFFNEFPSASNGLSLTADRALALADSEMTAGELFAAVQVLDEPRFMGDLSFFGVLDGLRSSPASLLKAADDHSLKTHPQQRLSLTELGKQVSCGEVHYLDVSAPDYWLGGVHINAKNRWCYNDSDQSFKLRLL
ncbi:DUF1835 domain-containing protein [Marinicella sediminis]|uniref:DUF1835 domain-containing protein n=1 Tax=Marinicella sediminis TaxID=1792834 RepID=A0ABV7J5Y5_9GAMM|nr:DUF1835 domain-containing protein [Marinicella sediminis]